MKLSLRDLLAELKEVLPWGFGILFVLSGLIEVSKIKVNPWSAAMKWLGQRINAEVLQKLDAVEAELAKTKQTLEDTQKQLEDHVTMDDERYMDLHRARILQFNTELIRGLKHTEEDFNEIMHNITCYERYCDAHPEYPNNRAAHAIKNINRVFDKRMEKGDFLYISPEQEENA